MPNFIKGSYSGGAPPLTIPNREVKPASADGTAYKWESRSLPDFIMSLCSSEHGLSFFGVNKSEKLSTLYIHYFAFYSFVPALKFKYAQY